MNDRELLEAIFHNTERILRGEGRIMALDTQVLTAVQTLQATQTQFIADVQTYVTDAVAAIKASPAWANDPSLQQAVTSLGSMQTAAANADKATQAAIAALPQPAATGTGTTSASSSTTAAS